MNRLEIPYHYKPRPYQIKVYNSVPKIYKRAILIWHRRSGKEKTCFNVLIREACKVKGIYYYFFPSYTQGKKILWLGMDKEGFRFLDHVPREIVKRKNDTDMLIELRNGSIIQVIGIENIDSIVGTNPIGCIFSEYSVQNPRGWEFVRPILTENQGWAIFNFTPRGENHAFDLYEMAKDNKDWFCQLLTVKDTKNKINRRYITDRMIGEERKSGMSEELIQQEFYCSFTSAAVGAYYATQLQGALDGGRIGNVPADPTIKVDTWWDLGIGDSMAIWFSQTVGKEIRLIDYVESSGEGFSYYAKLLQDRGYVYGIHNAPHDIEVRELGSGRSRKETASKLGINFRVVPNISIEDGIEATRNIFNRLWIDKNKCKEGLAAIRNYRKAYDEKNRIFRTHPVHDWSSHASDSLRMLGVGFKEKRETEQRGRVARTKRKIANPLTGY
jgi:hypothetical protein